MCTILYSCDCRTRADAIAKSTGCKGTYALMKLPDYDRVLQSVSTKVRKAENVLG